MSKTDCSIQFTGFLQNTHIVPAYADIFKLKMLTFGKFYAIIKMYSNIR